MDTVRRLAVGGCLFFGAILLTQRGMVELGSTLLGVGFVAIYLKMEQVFLLLQKGKS